MQFQRHRPTGNVKAETTMNTFFGTVGSPIQMSTFERHMEKKRFVKKQAHTPIPSPAPVQMVPPIATPTVGQVDLQPQPEPSQQVDEVETKKENKIVFHKELPQQPSPTANDSKPNDILSVPAGSSDDSEDDGADIATVRNDRGGRRDRNTEFMGITVEPVQQLKLDGARKAKIPHFMSAWFNADADQTTEEKKIVADTPATPIPNPVENVPVPVVTPPVPADASLTPSAATEETIVMPTRSTNPKLSGMQGRGHSQNINFSEIALGRMIGEGAFGKVYEGKWRGKGVAVKVLVCQELRSDILHEFQSEVEIMSVLRHPNICRLLGACMDPPHRALVVELMQRGSLWGVLRTQRKTLDMDKRTRFIYDTAKGMAYLHHFERPILHRDLKSPNLLVDKNYNIKLADFGLARVKAHVQTMTGNCGTVQWMAPEVLGNQKYTEKADVFSFAIVLWEIVTGECPYDGMSQIQAALGVLNRNLRPNIPRDCPPFFSRLMKACWNRQPELRPSFPHIVSAFRTYQTSLSETRASRKTAEAANAAVNAAAVSKNK